MQLRPYQQECVDIIDNITPGAYLVQMATGLGKCFSADTEILMYDGSIKKVQDIRDGDWVMGVDSNPRIVCGLARGTEEMFRITPQKGDSYTVNRSHILSLKITNMSNSRPNKCVTDCNGIKYTSGDICNISVDDYLKCSDTFKHVAKGWRTSVDFLGKCVDIPPYILGIWLGDGSAKGTNVTTMDADVVRELQRYCYNNDMELHVVSSQTSGAALTYSLTGKSNRKGCNALRNGLKKYELSNKHIPKDYLCNTSAVRLELLAGLLDSDGFLIDNVFEIATVRKCMSYDILFLARSLGFAAYCSTKIVNGKTYYRIIISGDTETIPTRVKRHQANKRSQKKNVLHVGIEVESVGVGNYYGFELRRIDYYDKQIPRTVSDDHQNDRLFLLADFTVVHNTVTFANIRRRGRMLILSHREELVRQPLKYFPDVYTGIEMAGTTAPPMAEVVSASVQSIVRRLDRYDPEYFDTIITDEAHHAAANSYKRIYSHFNPRIHIGFTATPGRGDKVRLDDVFSDIVFARDLRWGIKNKYLSDIYCRRVDIGFDLSAVRSSRGDYMPGELDAAMDGTADAIAEVYRDMATGATLIFAVSVHQAEEIASRIKGAVAVTGETKNRAAIVKAFTDGDIPCLVNCMVFTEGTDIPRVETVIIARPTQSNGLYAQMVGRGLRLYPGKERLNLIDCVGVTGRVGLCTAPSLLGLDMKDVPNKKQAELQGLLFELPQKVISAADCPESWIKNVQIVDIWAKEQRYDTHGVNWFKMPDGSLVVSLPDKVALTISCPDELGRAMYNGEQMLMQKALDIAFKDLQEKHSSQRAIWDLEAAKRWGSGRASAAQLKLIQKKHKGLDVSELTKLQASQILNRLLCGGKAG